MVQTAWSAFPFVAIFTFTVKAFKVLFFFENETFVFAIKGETSRAVLD